MAKKMWRAKCRSCGTIYPLLANKATLEVCRKSVDEDGEKVECGGTHFRWKMVLQEPSTGRGIKIEVGGRLFEVLYGGGVSVSAYPMYELTPVTINRGRARRIARNVIGQRERQKNLTGKDRKAIHNSIRGMKHGQRRSVGASTRALVLKALEAKHPELFR